jgi:endonuclease YncB( thermonuclease family)
MIYEMGVGDVEIEKGWKVVARLVQMGARVWRGRVLRVNDADGMIVQVGAENITVRLAGVDAPEICSRVKGHRAESMRQRSLLQAYVEGRDVIAVSDPRQSERDNYGRLIAYVFRSEDWADVNLWCVRYAGMRAWSRGVYARRAEFKFAYFSSFSTERFANDEHGSIKR